MFEPVGPLPASVYRRRRWTALITAVAGVVIVTLAISALLAPVAGTSPQAVNDRTAQLAAETDWQFSSSSSTAAPPGAAPAGAQPSGAPAPGEQIRPDLASAAAIPPSASGSPVPLAAAPAPAEAACADSALQVVATVDRPEYRVGDRPTFRLVVTNTGVTPCKRDFDAALQEVFVLASSGKRTWSSNDCFPGRSTDVRILAPSQPVSFAVTWSGLGSAPGCKTPRTAAGAGDYRLQARLGALISAPVVFKLSTAVRPQG